MSSIIVLPQTVSATDTRITAISAYLTYTLALKSDGTVWGWGYGPLGDDDAHSDSLIPFKVDNLTGVKAISAGGGVALALKTDGTVWSWGYNLNGSLGDGTTTYRNLPGKVLNLSGITAISAGLDHGLALKNDGTVWAWGSNHYGSLGDGTTIDRWLPIQVPGLRNVVSIETYDHSSYAIKADGSVWAWGLNQDGQLGDGTRNDQWSPINTGITNVKTVIARGHSAAALKLDGSVWQWGYGVKDQGITQQTPVQVPGLSHVIAVSGGGSSFIAILQDQTVWTWGANALAGDGTMKFIPEPVKVQGLSGKYSDIAGIGGFNLALKTDGTVWAWGNNQSGELGDGTRLSKFVPIKNLVDQTPIAPSVGSVNFEKELYTQPYEISVTFTKPMLDSSFNADNIRLTGDDGLEVALNLEQDINNLNMMRAVIKTLTPLSLGKHYTLQLINLMDIDGLRLQAYSYDFSVTLPFDPYQNGVSAGGMHSLYSVDGRALAWGDNSSGQLGDGTNILRSTPVQIQGLKTRTSNVAAGETHSLALLEDQSVAAWGSNNHGQVGDGTLTNQTTAVEVQNLVDIVAIAAGSQHSLALKGDGTVWAWGDNSSGQLGDGTQTERLTPIQINGLNSVISIAAGGDISMALTKDGKVWTWGSNLYGQLGNGTTNNQTTPVLLPSLTDITAVSAGWTHSLALKKDGSVWAWGDNRDGILGTGSTSDYSSVPLQVQSLSSITAISAGKQFSLANTNQQTLWAWGRNEYNQLGDGSPAKVKSTPVKVESITDQPLSQSISAGGYHALFGTSDLLAWGYNAFGQLGKGITEHVSTPEDTFVQNYPSHFRESGQEAPDTAIRISKAGWSYGTEAVVLVNQNAYADALPGTVLATSVKAPILLTDAKTLTASTSIELQRLQPKTVFILGGTSVVSQQIEQELKGRNLNVLRISGYDQYETSSKIARYLLDHRLISQGKAVLAYGENFPDALAVSSLAAYQGMPILLTRTHSLPSYTQKVLKELQASETIVVGGTAVIGAEVANQLPGMKRYAGNDKYDTAVAIAESMQADLNTIFVATGEQFPDALAGSVLAARTNSPIILVNKNLPTVSAYFIESHKDEIKKTMLLGGMAVVPGTILDKISYILNPWQTSPEPSNPESAPTNTQSPSPDVPSLTEPQILVASDSSRKVYEPVNIRLDKMSDGNIYPKKDLTLKWSEVEAPNYLIKVQTKSTDSSEYKVIFWAFVGPVYSYTLPASMLTEGNDYRITVAATTGTNRRAPDYKEWYAEGGYYPSMGVKISIHTLMPATFVYPSSGANVPKGDTIIQWNTFDWKDKDGNYEVDYAVELRDLTTNQWLTSSIDPNLGRNRHLISKSMLTTGHTYRFIVKAGIDGWNFFPDNHKVSFTTFTVR
ncbi:cell wall-binding repeat-containing protein [Desulfosporosinus sp. HMP52]|uniref:RCC1 domain-containing protein n=1 Tax=Desulfosporosinus sp. HMP52 TaxID=1487923 RepID=UPI00068CC7E4|nr:cell wall-binding repeat-containing protein [Desulfosporosinus sp. HMP52]